MKILSSLALALLLWLLTWIVLVPGAVVTAFFLQLWLDLPQERNFLYPGAALAATVGGGIWISAFLFHGRGTKIFIAACASIWIFSVAYSVFYPLPPQAEFVGSSPAEVDKIYRSTPNPPSFLFSIAEETRFVHVLTPDRPQTFNPNRNLDDPLSFGLAIADAGSGDGVVTVTGVISPRVKETVLQIPGVKAGRWNDFLIPAADLPPAVKSLEISVRARDEKSAQPWVLVSEPCVPKPKLGPNVILVVVDTMRADQINASNAPFLSRFSKEGVVFRQAMAASSWTVPATTSILTGLYPNQHGYISNAHLKFNPGVEFLARQFQQSGYRTAAVTANILVDPRYGFANGFDEFISLGRHQRFFWNSGRILNLKARTGFPGMAMPASSSTSITWTRTSPTWLRRPTPLITFGGEFLKKRSRWMRSSASTSRISPTAGRWIIPTACRESWPATRARYDTGIVSLKT